MNDKHCTVAGCKRKHCARGLCNTHYKKEHKAGNLDIRKGHGMYKTPTYTSWQCMKSRCENDKNVAFNHYGGRGITVCDEWRDSFINFLNDMGEAPKGLTIDRIDGSKGYYKDNCKWATKSEQSYNRRKQSNNKTGITGVWFSEKRKTWQVDINFNKKSNRLGAFNNFLDACCARKSAELRVEL